MVQNFLVLKPITLWSVEMTSRNFSTRCFAKVIEENWYKNLGIPKASKIRCDFVREHPHN